MEKSSASSCVKYVNAGGEYVEYRIDRHNCQHNTTEFLCPQSENTLNSFHTYNP